MAAGGKSFIPALVGFACICALVAAMFSKCSRDDVVPTLTANPNRKDGTAVYLLLDVSGSMDEAVPNDKGQQEPKLAIAKRAAIDVCKSVAKYADEDKSRTIQMAVASFSDDFAVSVNMGQPDPDA